MSFSRLKLILVTLAFLAFASLHPSAYAGCGNVCGDAADAISRTMDDAAAAAEKVVARHTDDVASASRAAAAEKAHLDDINRALKHEDDLRQATIRENTERIERNAVQERADKVAKDEADRIAKKQLDDTHALETKRANEKAAADKVELDKQIADKKRIDAEKFEETRRLQNQQIADAKALQDQQILVKNEQAQEAVAKSAEADAARDALSESLAPLKGKAPATVTGGYNARTGEVAARACGGGKCAEDHVVDALGGNKADVQFTKAVRPRTGEEVPVCKNCEASYGREPFPPGTRFKSDQ